MIKILTFCLSVLFVLNVQADTTDSKWKNIIELKKTGDHCLGLIAQEVEKVIPQVVYEDVHGVKSIAYQNIVALLIEAVKDQQQQIDELKRKLN